MYVYVLLIGLSRDHKAIPGRICTGCVETGAVDKHTHVTIWNSRGYVEHKSISQSLAHHFDACHWEISGLQYGTYGLISAYLPSMCHTTYLQVSCAEVEALLAKALTETCVQIANGGFKHSFALCKSYH